MSMNSFASPGATAPSIGRSGMVASSQALTSEVGLAILKQGGNAVDSVIAMAAMQVLVEPFSTGLGGDAFAIVCRDGTLTGLNASGAAPRHLGTDRLTIFRSGIADHGWESVTTPGQVAGWCDLHQRFGTLPLGELFAPAIHHAKSGFRITSAAEKAWKFACPPSEKTNREFRDLFFPNGAAPQVGETFANPDLASSLEIIGKNHQMMGNLEKMNFLEEKKCCRIW